MLQFNKAYSTALPEGELNEAPAASPIDFVSVAIGILRRQWLVLAVSLLVTTVLTSLYFWKSAPSYVAVATIVIETGKFQLFGREQASTLGEASVDSAGLENQIEIIKSEKIALKVIDDLHLLDTLAPQTRPWSGSSDLLSDFERRQNALAAFEKDLTVARRGMALMIEISFASSSRAFSAQVANAVADTYITDHMEARYEATRLGSAWLERRIVDLGVQSEAAEHAVVEFKTKNNIVEAGTGRLNEQQLAEINSRLGLARAQTSEAKTRLERITAITRAANKDAIINAAITGALTSDNLARLRTQYAELSDRATEFEQKYGRNHLSTVNLRTQIAQIRSAMVDEVSRLTQSFESDYNLALAREKTLESELAKSIAESESTSHASIRLRELENAAQTSTALYENFRKRYAESLEQQSFQVPEARVLTRAVPPLRPERKGLLKRMAAIFGAGAALGVGVALFRELMDRTYRTASQIEQSLQANCLALVPYVGSSHEEELTPDRGIAWEQRIFEVPQGPIWYAAGSPFSRYAEALRAVKLAIDLNTGNKSIKVIGVTSSLPGEGKSTIAASLALTIGGTGARVILLDCDLRNPTLTRTFVRGVKLGFLEVLTGSLSLQDALWTDRSGLISFLPFAYHHRIFQSAEIMTSKATKNFFQRLRDSYDYVIVDLPPLAPIVDARATAHLIDASIFVVEWGRTKISVAEHTLVREPGICENLLGVVLNKVDMKLIASYDGKNSSLYDKSRYSQYVSD